MRVIKLTKVLSFKVSSALKSVIGRDLITNDFVAIFELVKNSADAGATRVDIVFKIEGNDKDRIYIIDNGKGMDYEDMVRKWLVVAYSAKKDGTEDAKGGVYAGNKGVGRFSCDRLGGVLRIQAKKNGSDHVDILDVDWGEFERDSQENFSDISVFHNTDQKFTLPSDVGNIETGVVIEISYLRDSASWTRSKLLKLRSHLAKLINPFGDENSKIEVYLHSHNELSQDYKEKRKEADGKLAQVVNGPIKNVIFETLKNKTTWIRVWIEGGWIYSDLVDRSELIYSIREKAISYPDLLDSRFECQIFYLNTSAKSTFKRQMAVHSVEFGSLFLFRNGFRVFPVGEPGDDYWLLDRRKQQGHSRYLGTREIIGKVDIAGSEEKFKESSSRDKGLIDTDASRQLFDCVINKCLRRLESYVVGISWKDNIDKTYDTAVRLSLDSNRSRIIALVANLAKSNDIELLKYNANLVDVLSEKSKYFENSIDELEDLARKYNSVKLLEAVNNSRRKYEEEVKSRLEAERIAKEEAEARKAAELKAEIDREAREKAEKERAVYSHAYQEEQKRNLFLLSTGSRDKEQLESFMHQIIIYAVGAKNRIQEAIVNIGNQKNGGLEAKEYYSTVLSELLELNGKIITTSRFATSANFKLDSEKVIDDICAHIEQYIDKICTAYHSRISISAVNNVSEFVMEFRPIELGMVIDNLVSNAKKSRASKIDFVMTKESPNVMVIDVFDDGVGIDRNIIEKSRIFDKGFTTTDGSGLGLYHSKKQIENIGGELILVDEQPIRGAHFRIRLNKNEANI